MKTLEEIKEQVAKEQLWNGSPSFRDYPKEFEIMANEIAQRFAKEFAKEKLEEVRHEIEKELYGIAGNNRQRTYNLAINTSVSLIDKTIEEL